LRPRIRTIKPDFFENKKISTIGVGSRFVAVGLISAADDRGRIWCLPGLRTYIFPHGDVSEKQFEKALAEVIASGFAWRYEAGQWTYLWLPGFWEHQRINRPSESELPPHPDDPFGGLPIREALDQFTAASRKIHGLISEHSVNDHGALITSRAGARFPSLPFPEELQPHLEKTLEVLRPLAERHGAKAINPDSLASVMAARPRKPFVRAAYDCAAWWDGSSRRLKDAVSAYRNWLDKTDDLAGTEQLDGSVRVISMPRSPVLERMDRWKAGYEEGEAS